MAYQFKKRLFLLLLILMGLFVTGLFVRLRLSEIDTISGQSGVGVHQAMPLDENFYDTAFQFNYQKYDLSATQVVAGIIPHHLLAADLIAEFFHNLSNKNYDAIVLIGPNHYNTGSKKIITSANNWQTPYGILINNEYLFNALSYQPEVGVDEDVMSYEHSIASEVSFIKKIFPNTTILPLILKSSTIASEADFLADKIYQLSKQKNILVLASVDFSHYQTSAVAQEHDQASLDAIIGKQFDLVYELDIDSPPTIYTLLKYSELSGSSFQILNNSNSALLAGDENIATTTSYVTGYFLKF